MCYCLETQVYEIVNKLQKIDEKVKPRAMQYLTLYSSMEELKNEYLINKTGNTNDPKENFFETQEFVDFVHDSLRKKFHFMWFAVASYHDNYWSRYGLPANIFEGRINRNSYDTEDARYNYHYLSYDIGF